MSGFIQGEDRQQATLFPESLDEYVGEDSPVRVRDRSDRSSGLPPAHDAEAVYLRIFEQRALSRPGEPCAHLRVPITNRYYQSHFSLPFQPHAQHDSGIGYRSWCNQSGLHSFAGLV